MRVQTRDLNKALERLQAASERINLPRRWSLESGSGTMGIAYRLTDWHPYFGEHTKEIGKTRTEALLYITTLADAMDLIWSVLNQRQVPNLGGEEWITLRATAREEAAALPQGLCGNRNDHAPHCVDSETLGRYWCHADQKQRQPYASEARLRVGQYAAKPILDMEAYGTSGSRLRAGATHRIDESPEEGGVRFLE